MAAQRKIALMGFAACLLLMSYTGYKIHKMLVIHGDLPGARLVKKVITAKVELPGRHGQAYWITWDHNDPSRIGNHRVNVDRERWMSLAVGDEIELRYAGFDSSPYLKDGIYVSIGNFVFDGALLAAEFIGAVICAVMLVRRPKGRKARKSSPSAQWSTNEG